MLELDVKVMKGAGLTH